MTAYQLLHVPPAVICVFLCLLHLHSSPVHSSLLTSRGETSSTPQSVMRSGSASGPVTLHVVVIEATLQEVSRVLCAAGAEIFALPRSAFVEPASVQKATYANELARRHVRSVTSASRWSV